MYSLLCAMLVVLAVLFALINWNRRICSYWRSRNITFIEPVPLFSWNILNSIFITKSRLATMYKKAEFDDYVGFFQFRNPVLMVCSPHLVDIILRKEFESFSATRSELVVNEKNDPLSQNLLSLSLRKWKNLRKQMAHLFAPHNLRAYVQYIDLHANSFVNDLETDNFVNVTKMSHLYSVKTIMSCIMGKEFSDIEDPTKIHPVLGEKSLQHGFWPLFWWNLKLGFPRFFKFLGRSGYNAKARDFFLNHMKKEIDTELNEDFYDRPGFLRQLIDNDDLKNESTSDEAFKNMICAQLYTLFVGGTDSITTTLSSTLYELARHPVIFRTVREEVLDILAIHGSFTYSALLNLYYLECVIKEVLRLHPPGYSITRKCTKTVFLPDYGILIEKDTDVVIPVLELHKDPRHFKNPMEFNPLRFTESSSLGILPGSYLPFGDGPRRCVGILLSLLEIKMVIAKLCVEFKAMELCESQREALETEELSRVYMLKNDLYIKFTKCNTKGN